MPGLQGLWMALREAGEGIVPKIKMRLSKSQTGEIVWVTSMAGLFSKKVWMGACVYKFQN